MEANDIGVFLACSEYRIPAERLDFFKGAAQRLGPFLPMPLGRILVKAAHACMAFSGLGHTAPAMHLKLVSDASDWSLHHQDVARNVSQALSLVEPMHKQAFSELAPAVGAAGRGLGYASLGAGAGAGALYWLLSRHANQEAADIEAKKKQVDYYHRLSHELHESMRRKYSYPSLESDKPEKAP